MKQIHLRWLCWRKGMRYAIELRPSSFSGLEIGGSNLDKKVKELMGPGKQRYRRSIRILQFFSRLLSFVFSLIISLVLAYTLACYYITKDRSMPPAHTSIWPMPTVVWPTYLLLLFGVITMFIDFIMLAVSCCCLHDSFGGFSSYAMLGAKVVAWLVGMVIFRTMKRADSVWGYACNDELVAEVRTYMNFDKLCTIQVCWTPSYSLQIRLTDADDL